MIEEWYKEAVVNFPEKKLIKLAADMAYDIYKERKKKRPFEIVVKQQEKELRKKGVSEIHIQFILEKIEQARKKDISERKIERIVKRNQKINRNLNKKIEKLKGELNGKNKQEQEIRI